MTEKPTYEQIDDFKETHTWEETAKEFGFKTAEAARGYFRKLRMDMGDDGVTDSVYDEDIGKPKLSYDNENNVYFQLVTDKRITDPKKLIEVAGLDLNEWEIVDHKLKKWEGFSKIKHARLKWHEGKIDRGEVFEDGKINVVELLSIQARLVRKAPIALQPVPQPVRIELDLKKAKSPKHTEGGWTLSLPDPQIGYGNRGPYHDERVMEIALQFATVYADQISNVVFAGDWMDLSELSTFLEEPVLMPSLQKAINETASWIAKFRKAVPHARFYYLEGNHEARLLKSVMKKMPEFYGIQPANAKFEWPVLSVPFLLGLEEMGVTYVPDYPDEGIWIDEVQHRHGTFYGPFGAAVTKYLRAFKHDIVAGHDHRVAVASTTVWGLNDVPRVVSAMIPGAMCRVDNINPPPGRKKKQDHQNAIGLVIPGSEGNRLIPLPILQDGLIFGTNLFSA